MSTPSSWARLQSFKSLMVLIVILPILAGPVTARAFDDAPIVTDRPDFTESTDTVPFGRLQLEGGFTHSRTGGLRENSLGEILLRIATGRRTEARFALNSYTLTSGAGITHGMEDATLGMKLRLADPADRFSLLRPAVSLIVETSLPTGASAYRSNDLQPGAKLLLGWDLDERWSMASNLNYNYASENGDRFDQFSASLSFGHSLNDRLGAYLEAFSFLPGGRHGPDVHYFNVGATYLVNPDFQLDVRVGRSHGGGASPDDFIGIGAARRW